MIKSTLSSFLRLAIITISALLITYLISYQISDLTKIYTFVENVDSAKKQMQETTYVQINEDALKDLAGIVQLPLSLLYFDVFLTNTLRAQVNDTKQIILIYINTDVFGTYTGKIESDGKPHLIAKSILGKSSINPPLTRSFTPYNDIHIGDVTPLKGPQYSLSIWPDTKSFIALLFFVGFPVAYGLLVLLNNYFRFVKFGEPFTKNKKEN